MKKFFVLMFVLVTLPSCAGVTKTIATAVSVIDQVQDVMVDAQTVVKTLETIKSIFFLAHPMPEAQIKVEKVFVSVTQAINAANRALSGTERVTQEQFDLAFADFRASYKELTKLMSGLGILDEAGRSGLYGASKTMQEPLAMNYKVKI